MALSLENLNERLMALENKPVSLPYPLSYTDQKSVEKTTDIYMPDKVFEMMWKKLFHWITFFESLDGYTITNVGSSSSAVDGTQILMTTGAIANDSTTVLKSPSFQGLITFSQDSNMRSNFTVNHESNYEHYIVLGSLTGGQGGYGFKISDGSIYGYTNDGSSTSSILLQAISTSTIYSIEARYRVNSNVIFYIDNVEVGILSTTLPSPVATPNITLMTLKAKTTDANAKNIQISFFEYLQRRNVLL